ncbi:ubiquinol oxidase subunit II [Actimicrobium sp. CCI2.3]|uniref:ubiquinol oxidase subunit II n=1 Tax=Actimicrobium sp. CCI2.3 TaxID=3048616 RepID=UPI002AB530D8|nr:ubiquinol oxidase subunit II [Actimicrobium sp. CCI2.3]MDY7575438.1 ubiquinol oxidase subunit II [Actimicrobium sp. CCI2.3]MEB0021348.1 ubiquinol oxidase subunit II [Actimicrobium sp. CCI2.3]
MIALNLRRLLLLSATLPLAGCNTVLLSPSGYIAQQQGNLLIVSTLLMLLIIVPVIVLIILFAWRYRKSNTAAIYEPDWDHSTRLELIIWGAPLLIIIVLGTITWISTHKLDPYRALTHIDADRPIAAGTKPLIVEVVALDWKWLFIYPELGIASLNELAAPVDVPIRFKITASTVMNSFYIPALAGQIYAMPGMQTSLNAVINKQGVYDGFSANYSGAGFSDMRFKFHGMTKEGFDGWVKQVRDEGKTLRRASYVELEKPSERVPVQRFGEVDGDLFHAIVNRCVVAGEPCMDATMMKDAHAAMGHGNAKE